MPTLKNVFAKTWSLIGGLPRRLAKNRIALIAAILVVLAAGLFTWRHLAAASKGSGYTTARAAYGDVIVSISASGNIVAMQSVTLTFKSEGYVKACSVKLGDLVKAGQVLAEEETSDLQSSLDQAEASLQSAQASYDKLIATKPQKLAQDEAQVEQAKANLDAAEATLERDKQLLGIGAISQVDLDSAQNSYRSALTQYKSAQYTLAQDQSSADQLASAAQVKNAQAQVATALDNLDNAEMTAPFEGYISTITGNAGQWTGSGTSSSTSSSSFSIVMTSTGLQIEANVNEADISKVGVGQEVSFTVDTYPNETFTGKIIALSPNATTVSNVQMYEAHISIDDYSKLKSGMPASISIITSSASHVIVAPQTALTYAKTYMASLAAAGSGGGSKQTATPGGSTTSQSVTATQGGATTSQGVTTQSQGSSTPSQGVTTQSQGSSSASQGSSTTSQGVTATSQGVTATSQGVTATSQGSTGSSSSSSFVVVLVNGKPEVRSVQTGLTDDVNVEIKSGLNEGDVIITGSAAASKSSGSSSTGSSSSSSSSKSSGSQGGGGMGGPPPGMF